ncbi:hypothetical protein P8631_03740 [Guyparkeria sp. 1SP6A2]|nr:hypothetical protein [Guyparkeria sp. 1SP6A2]
MDASTRFQSLSRAVDAPPIRLRGRAIGYRIHHWIEPGGTPGLDGPALRELATE